MDQVIPLLQQQEPGSKIVDGSFIPGLLEKQADGALSTLYLDMPVPIYQRKNHIGIDFPTGDSNHDGFDEKASPHNTVPPSPVLRYIIN